MMKKQFGLVCIFGCALSLIAAPALAVTIIDEKQQQPAGNSLANDTEPGPVFDDPDHNKMYKAVFKRLDKMKKEGSKKVAQSDWFIIGTATIDPRTRHADVCFQAFESREETAKRVVEFATNTEYGMERQWHVFHRAVNEKKANFLLGSVRDSYDRMLAYREMLKRKYRAKSTRRC